MNYHPPLEHKKALAHWRNDITGLRALAVIPVLLFHAFPELLPGGFLGVDVFFVISGYLIAGIIFRGLLAGNFSYIDFYAKRIRRIIPNLLLVMTFVFVMGFFFMTATEFEQLGKHLRDGTFFIENFRLLKEADYFDIASQYKPLLHLWSLAIEEQFYIGFPLILALFCFFAKHRCTFSTLLLWGTGVLVLLLTVGSFGTCLAQSDLTKAFYYPGCRFWEIGIGIVLAWGETFALFDFSKWSAGVRHTLSALGTAMIVGAIAGYTKDYRTPGLYSLLPTIGAFCLIAAGARGVFNRTLLSWRPMIFVGLISYSVYLWHWPLLAYLHLIVPTPAPWMAGIVLLLSVVISAAVYRWIEVPVRRTNKMNERRLLIILIAGMVVSAGLGMTIAKKNGFPQRPFNQKLFNIDELKKVNEWTHLSQMSGVETFGGVHKVKLGNEAPRIFFAGDSHTAHYSALIEKLSQEHNVPIEIFARGGERTCILGEPDWIDDQSQKDCNEFKRLFLKELQQTSFETIVFSQRWDSFQPLNFVSETGEKIPFDKGGFQRYLKKFRTLLRPDQRLIVLLDNPGGKAYDPRYPKFNRLEPYFKDIQTDSALSSVAIMPAPVWSKANQDIVDALSHDATIIDVTKELFPDGTVPIFAAFFNENHMNTSWVRDNAHFFDPLFEEAAAQKP